MNRWMFRIVVCLLLGVVTTVGVAWGLAWRAACVAHFDESEGVPSSDLAHRWTERIPEWFEMQEPGLFVTYRSLGFSETRMYTVFGLRAECMIVYDAGWPLYALWGEAYLREDGLLTREASSGEVPALTQVIANHSGSLVAFVPWFPHESGFVIDTLFYAVIWFGLFFGIGAVQRSIRRRRGRCVKCGYDLRGQRSAFSDQKSVGNQGCPECGLGREDADL